MYQPSRRKDQVFPGDTRQTRSATLPYEGRILILPGDTYWKTLTTMIQEFPRALKGVHQFLSPTQ
jgi:hypothetical protein